MRSVWRLGRCAASPSASVAVRWFRSVTRPKSFLFSLPFHFYTSQRSVSSVEEKIFRVVTARACRRSIVVRCRHLSRSVRRAVTIQNKTFNAKNRVTLLLMTCCTVLQCFCPQDSLYEKRYAAIAAQGLWQVNCDWSCICYLWTACAFCWFWVRDHTRMKPYVLIAKCRNEHLGVRIYASSLYCSLNFTTLWTNWKPAIWTTTLVGTIWIQYDENIDKGLEENSSRVITLPSLSGAAADRHFSKYAAHRQNQVFIIVLNKIGCTHKLTVYLISMILNY